MGVFIGILLSGRSGHVCDSLVLRSRSSPNDLLQKSSLIIPSVPMAIPFDRQHFIYPCRCSVRIVLIKEMFMKFRVHMTVPVVLLFILLSLAKAFPETPSEHEMGDCIGRYWDAQFHKAMIRNSIVEGLTVFGIMTVLGMLLIIIKRSFSNPSDSNYHVIPRTLKHHLGVVAISLPISIISGYMSMSHGSIFTFFSDVSYESVFIFLCQAIVTFSIISLLEILAVFIVRAVVKIWKRDLTFFPVTWRPYVILFGISLFLTLGIYYILLANIIIM